MRFCHPMQIEIEKILTEIDALKSRVDYRNFLRAYKYIGKGSGRKVFVLNDKYVLKYAYNEKGLAQNEVETDKYFSAYEPALFARVYSGENKKIIIMQRGEKITRRIFKEKFGFSFLDLSKYITERYSYWKLHTDITTNKKLLAFIENKFEQHVANMDLHPQDFKSINAWKLICGKICLVDFGLTKNIFKELYINKNENK
jgi:hypothetical protein